MPLNLIAVIVSFYAHGPHFYFDSLSQCGTHQIATGKVSYLKYEKWLNDRVNHQDFYAIFTANVHLLPKSLYCKTISQTYN